MQKTVFLPLSTWKMGLLQKISRHLYVRTMCEFYSPSHAISHFYYHLKISASAYQLICSAGFILMRYAISSMYKLKGDNLWVWGKGWAIWPYPRVTEAVCLLSGIWDWLVIELSLSHCMNKSFSIWFQMKVR